MKPHAVGAILAAVMLTALPAAAQSAATHDASEPMSDDLKGIRQALDRLVALLETAEHHQRVDLVLKRIELRERRMEPLERRLRSTENEIEGIEEQLKALERMRAQHEELLDDEIREGADTPHSETRRILDDIERSQAGATERLEAVRVRLQQYENDLADGRREIEILDEMLLDLLEDDRR